MYCTVQSLEDKHLTHMCLESGRTLQNGRVCQRVWCGKWQLDWLFPTTWRRLMKWTITVCTFESFSQFGWLGARDAHWPSHSYSLYPIPAMFLAQVEQKSQKWEKCSTPSLLNKPLEKQMCGMAPNTFQDNTKPLVIGLVMLLFPPLILLLMSSGHRILRLKTTPFEAWKIFETPFFQQIRIVSLLH